MNSINGIKFFCKDIQSGKEVMIKDDDGKQILGKSFGMNPDVTNKKYIYNRIMCDTNGNKPSFISGVGSTHGDRINSLKLYNCKYLNK